MGKNDRNVMICVDCRTAIIVTQDRWNLRKQKKCPDCGSLNWVLEDIEGYMLDELKKD